MKDPMTRSPNNPILSAKDIPYPASLVFNAGVCKWQGRYVMLFRNDHGIDEGEYKAARARGEAKGFSTNIGIATSADGVHWEVGPKPVFQMRDDEILRVNWMGTDPAKRAFYRAFRDFNPLSDIGIG